MEKYSYLTRSRLKFSGIALYSIDNISGVVLEVEVEDHGDQLLKTKSLDIDESQKHKAKL